MKEAAGEANMTVITIVLIAIILGVGTVIVTNVLNNTKKSTACTNAGAIWQGGKCYNPKDCSTSGDKTVCSGKPLTFNNGEYQ